MKINGGCSILAEFLCIIRPILLNIFYPSVIVNLYILCHRAKVRLP